MRTASKLFLSAILASATLTLPGCRTEFYNYISTPDAPQTVSLKDTRTGETLWTVEVPVGRKLHVVFLQQPGRAEAQGWDEMQWDLVASDKDANFIRNTMRVPPPSARRLDVALRAPGEFPPATKK
jgi:hypothetical protein